MNEGLTNRQFAEKDKNFLECCKVASEKIGKEVKPTSRQASKFRRKKGLAYLYGRALAVFILILNLTLIVYAKDIPFTDENCIRAIVGEASGEGYYGLLAVAVGLRNRGTLKGVYGLNAKHVDKEPQWVWDMAKRAWKESKDNKIHEGTDWESTDFPVPDWAEEKRVVYRYKKHIYYKKEKD